MFEYTGADGIMIGRANLGNPWITKNIVNGLNGNNNNNNEYVISNKEKLKVIKEHLKLQIEEKGEYVGIREMRKHICWYIKNLKDSSKLREKVNKIESVQELEACLEEYFSSI